MWTTKQCQQCKTEMSLPPYQSHRKFCTLLCYWLYKKENHILPPSRKGSVLSPQHKLILQQINRGKIVSLETRQKISIAHMGNLNPMFGRFKNLHPQWVGSQIKFLDKRIRNSTEYKIWRTAVFERDDYICQKCKKRGNGILNADHIKPFALFPELRFVVDNGRTLCIRCHRETNTYGRRKKDLERMFNYV